MRNAMINLYMTPIDYGGGPAMMDFSPFAMPDADPFAGASAGASTYGAGGGGGGIRPSAPPIMFAPRASAFQEPMGFGSFDQMAPRPRNFMAGGGYRPPPMAPYGRGFGGFGARSNSAYGPVPGRYGGLNPYGQMF